MIILRASLIYLLINTREWSVTGFWSPFKHKNESPIKIDKTKELTEIKEITWDDGEVAWENMQEYHDINQTYIVKKRPLIKLLPVYKSTPLYEAIEMDQTKIASISAFVRTTYKETFNINTIISELDSKISNHYLIIPTEFVIISMLTGLAIAYNKTNETEKDRLEKLYILTELEDYHIKYAKMKRISMAIIIVLSCLTTKNVLPVG
uniref:Uncharacterized protein n=1 Tax=viral metagenome TaxID=1070528 RepID=A0A6C0JY20_9ZZZZ